MRLIRVVNTNKKYKGKDGKEHYNENYYIQLDNLMKIAIKPAFTSDYEKLKIIAEKITR